MTGRLLATACVAALLGCGPASVGTARPAPSIAAPCESDAGCGPGLVCSQGSCVAYEGDVQDPCYDDMDCALHLACVHGSCAPRDAAN